MIIDEAGGAVEIGGGCLIATSATLIGPLKIGNNVQIGHGTVIGAPGEHKLYGADWDQVIEIGSDTVIREHVAIHRGVLPKTPDKGSLGRFWGTRIGRGCFIMHGTYVAHDCLIEDDVTLSPGVGLAGHCVVLDGATLGMQAAVHQKVTIGGCAMVGMGATVLHDVPTSAKVVGTPARVIGTNEVGLERNNYDEARMAKIETDFQELRGARPGMKTAYGQIVS